MAARARVRREEADRRRLEAAESALAEVRARARALRGDDWSWLNGWPRMGDFTVLVGNGVHCLGCGHDRGITTVAISEDWRAPGPEPAWPLAEDGCPICAVMDAP